MFLRLLIGVSVLNRLLKPVSAHIELNEVKRGLAGKTVHVADLGGFGVVAEPSVIARWREGITPSDLSQFEEAKRRYNVAQARGVV